MGPDGSAAFDALAPAVAYNSQNNGYFVVWQGDTLSALQVNDEFEIFGQIVGANGAELGGDLRLSRLGPDGDPYFDSFSPSVAYNSADNQFLVVWWGNDNTGSLAIDELEIFGQRLDAASGLALGADDFRLSDLGFDDDPAHGAFYPAVTYNPAAGEYLVVWFGDDNTIGLADNEYEIFGQRLAGATGAELGPNDFRISHMGPDGVIAPTAQEPAVGYNPAAGEYLVVWFGRVDIEFEIYGQSLAGASGAPLGGPLRVSTMGADGSPIFSAFGAAVASQTASGQHLVVWVGDDNTPGLVDDDFEVYAQRLDTVYTLRLPMVFR
jgi:hypothetical protein